MYLKKVLTVIIFILFYQNHLYSKSNSFNNFNPKNLSNYFSGIVAFENKKNSDALNFYNSSLNLSFKVQTAKANLNDLFHFKIFS